MPKASKIILASVVAVNLFGCGPAADKPNMTVTPPKNPAAIAVLDKIKALPDGAARREFMNSHEAETQTLRSDPGAWVQASKLAWGDVSPTPLNGNSARPPGK
jgi:hypothetical protein